ncbi:MAG: hypothetical protein HKN12_10210 [Gemmatimonadetes bacterium]|nr:hypothetical protein [Gemmatimonadota bacterium]
MDRRKRFLTTGWISACLGILALVTGGCGEALDERSTVGPGEDITEEFFIGEGGSGGGGNGGGGNGGNSGPFGRLHYSDLTYQGAFKCPDQGSMSWAVGAMAYVPTRNTLVVVGKDAAQNWFEISIPTPVISPNKSPGDLNTAQDISGWMEVVTPLHTKLGNAKSIGGMTFYNGRFWAGMYEFYNVAGRDNLGLISVDANFGDHRGAWRVGPAGVDTPAPNVFHANKTHTDVMVIPDQWRDAYTPGKPLAGGRHRGAGAFGGGKGPALYAFDADINKASGEHQNGVPLMYFKENGAVWPGYRKADGYHSIWISSADQQRQTLLVAAKKGLGPNFYGPGPSCNPDKGWHGHPYEPRLYFIDVNDLGEVARGNLDPWAVQAYEEVMPGDIAWKSPTDAGADPNCRFDWFRDFAFDEANGRLFATQPKAYDVPGQSNRMIVHVWQVN